MTTKPDFAFHVENTLEEAVQIAEQHAGKILSRQIGFRWLEWVETIWTGIVEAIVSRVYVDEDHIFPCVDIGVGDISPDGKPIIVAHVAGYAACPFQQNWTGRDGPFGLIVGFPFLAKMQGTKLDSGQAFGMIIPAMKDLKK